MKYFKSAALVLLVYLLPNFCLAAFNIDYGNATSTNTTLTGKAKEVPRPVLTGQSAIESRQKLLLDNSVVWLSRSGECGGSVTSGTGNNVPLSVAAGMIVPRGWQVYSALDDLGEMNVSWVGGEHWLSPIERMAEKYRVIINADCSSKKLVFVSRPALGHYAEHPTKLNELHDMGLSIATAPPENIKSESLPPSVEGDSISVIQEADEPNSKTNTTSIPSRNIKVLTPSRHETIYSYAMRHAINLNLGEPVYRVKDITRAMAATIDIYKKKRFFWNEESSFSLQHALSELGLYFAVGTDSITRERHLVVTDIESVSHSQLTIYTIRHAPISEAAIQIANSYGYTFGDKNAWGYDTEWTNPYSYHLVATDVRDGLLQLLDNYPVMANIVPSTKTVFITPRVSRR